MWLCIADHYKDTQLQKKGLKAMATVVDTVITYSKPPQGRSFDKFKDRSVWGIYAFKARNSQTYRVQATTSGTHMGKQTTIYYDPANPDGAYYLDGDAYGFYLGMGIGFIITALGVFFFWRSGRR